MPAAARGKFFFSMSLQISRIFVIMLFVALASFSCVFAPWVCASVKTRDHHGVMSSVEGAGSSSTSSSP